MSAKGNTMTIHGHSGLVVQVVATIGLLLSSSLAAAQGAELFPTPFLVEHQLIQQDPDGSVFVAPAVTDTYGSSFVVSQRQVLDRFGKKIGQANCD